MAESLPVVLPGLPVLHLEIHLSHVPTRTVLVTPLISWGFFLLLGLNEVDYSLYPCREVQLQWLQHYLQAYKRLGLEDEGQGSKSRGECGALSEGELETLYVQVNQFALVSMRFMKKVEGFIGTIMLDRMWPTVTVCAHFCPYSHEKARLDFKIDPFYCFFPSFIWNASQKNKIVYIRSSTCLCSHEHMCMLYFIFKNVQMFSLKLLNSRALY